MDFRTMCIRNGLFTCGSNEQYAYVIDRFDDAFCQDRPFVVWGDYIRICAMTFICSDMDATNYGQVCYLVMQLVEACGYRRDSSGDFIKID